MEDNVTKILDDLGISFSVYEHSPVNTVEEAREETAKIDADATKNLFLRNDKGKRHFLVSVPAEKRVDLKTLSGELEEKRLSFASKERLQKYLGLEPGSVSPFGLINDKENSVEVVIDKDLLQYDKLGYHPNANTATVVIAVEDFKKFLDWTGNSVKYIKIPE